MNTETRRNLVYCPTIHLVVFQHHLMQSIHITYMENSAPFFSSVYKDRDLGKAKASFDKIEKEAQIIRI